MPLSKYHCSLLAVLLGGCLLANAAVARDYVLGGGFSLDNANGKSVVAAGDVAIGESTWISGALGRSRVDLPRFLEIETSYASIGVDTYWDPAGLRLGAAYWGDSDLLDSIDYTASVYSRNDRGSLAIDAEYRDFELELPPIDILPRTNIPFDAKGLGLSGRLEVSKNVDLHLSGMSYEYSIELQSENADRVVNVLSISRLSLLSSLIDWEVSAGVGVDVGLRHWQVDVSRWRGAFDGADSQSITLSYLTPLTTRTDIEFSFGYDDSELYGGVAVFNAFLYFYGGD